MSDELEVVYFGWLDIPGHCYHAKQDPTSQIAAQAVFGSKIDGGYLPANPHVNYVFMRSPVWSAISFWDQSGDNRPGSNSAFIVHAGMSCGDLVALARRQWPEVFARKGFPLDLTKNNP